jgi:quinolinate synthase
MNIESLYAIDEKKILHDIALLKTSLADNLLILGHHYQREEVIQFADITGDSLKLAQQAASTNAKYIIFCGVHFMAETADILTDDSQQVILPDLAAGLSQPVQASFGHILNIARSPALKNSPRSRKR